jgi:hypothetical protein
MTPIHAYIAIPCYTGQITAPTAVSLVQAVADARRFNYEITLDIRPLDSLLTRCRNTLVARFLASGATDLVFWDDDIAPEPGGFARLLQHRVDCVAGCYRARSDPERYIFRPLPDHRDDPQTGLVEVEGIGAGFLRISRTGLERTIAHFSDLWIEEPGAPPMPWLFDNEIVGRKVYSEDFVFCRRFREAGGKIWIDPNIGLIHTGQKTFAGKYGDFWRGQLAARTSPAELLEAQAQLQATYEAMSSSCFDGA